MPAARPPSALAFTGSGTLALLLTGFALLVVGGALYRVSTRREERETA